MTAAVSSTSHRHSDRLRPVDSQRDMAPIADVLDAAFAGELDASGRRMVESMRAVGKAGWLGWLFGRLILPPAAYPKGFVWEEDDKVVGNASLLQVDGHPDRWVMANVAVRPDYQRRGIARQLVVASVEWLQERKAKQIILQVRSENSGAQILYADQHFQPLTTRTTWTRWGSQMLPERLENQKEIRVSGKGDWKLQLSFANQHYPEGLIWPYPNHGDLFKPGMLGGFFGLNQARDWLWQKDGQLLGNLSARYNLDRAGWRLQLMVAPEARGRIERPLLTRCLADLALDGSNISLDYPAGVAEETLEDLGFRSDISLTWMMLDLEEERTK